MVPKGHSVFVLKGVTEGGVGSFYNGVFQCDVQGLLNRIYLRVEP
jgi:hypothetical protein